MEDFLSMRFFRILTLAFALLLTLVGNMSVVGFCLSEGKFSLAGINACSTTASACKACCSACMHADHASEAPSGSHEKLDFDLDETIPATLSALSLPAVGAFFLQDFLAILKYPETQLSPTRVNGTAPPDSRLCASPPKIGAALPLLA